MDPDIAIIGLSGRFPGASGVAEFWENLRSGAESISFFGHEELLAAGVDPDVLSDPRYVRAAPVLSDVTGFDARLFGYSPREASCIDPQQRVFLECAWEALETAGHDPAKFGGAIGVYAGSSISTYLLLGGLLPQLGEDYLFTVLGNDKDFLPSRVSYKLGLTGPSIAVQSACSTGLVAVHVACQGLLNLECDMALAGGVSVRVPQRAGYLYREGGVLSPDGHCRAFDASAGGTVFGSGAGVVVLKRMADALADGDRVRAVIKGSAVSNDGAEKAGFAAPSVTGQARAVAEALSRSGADATSLSYVEAHGTGTRLGDPIEIAALSAAFRAFTGKKGFCAIGSVKTNIGHADAAAGTIGLIKTVLALEHGLIPPTLHYTEPNPALGLERSPFFVSRDLMAWKPADGLRRAGVNSLGMGGTNAFMVVEEPPSLPVRGGGPDQRGGYRPDQLLRLSAQTESALEAATARLAGHLAAHPGADLADVAYTLHMGRRDLPCRRVVVCREAGEAVRLLRNPRDPAVITERARDSARDVVFLFPGQGTQYPHMGAGLDRTEGVYAEHLDRCCEILRPMLSRDLREVLYPDPGTAAGELDRTEFTQPALFAVEYALARLWMSWGVRPAACLGHSLGELVAACLAGVFSLEDALRLVAFRGQLLQRLPPGSMLALPLAEEEARPYLGPDVCLAAVNGPAQVVVAGPVAAMRALAGRLSRAGVPARPLKSARAFHSAAVGPAADTLECRVAGLERSAPRLRFISGVTGTWITDEDAADPRYWARQLRQPVRFADGLRELAASTDGVFLEVGPGHTLGNLARRHVRSVLASLPDAPGDPPDAPASDSDRSFLLRTAGRLWLAGAGIDGLGFYAGQRPARLALPPYPFQRERYWADHAGSGRPSGRPARSLPEPPAEPSAEPPPEPDGPARTAVEGAIAAVWRSVLGVGRIGAHDDFFSLGGTSVLIPEVLGRVNEVFDVDLPVLTLLESPTVAGLAQCVERVYELS